jgi:protein O-GlcNAc transferase
MSEQALDSAIRLQRAGELQKAVEAYQLVLQAEPANVIANQNMGLLAVQMGYPEAALSFFGVALDSDPTQGDCWLNYIATLHQVGKAGEAKQILALARQQGLAGNEVDMLELRLLGSQKATHPQKSPSSRDINALIAVYAAGHLDEAAMQALEMIRAFPMHGCGWKTLGVVYQHKGRYADALLLMQKAAELLPNDAEAHNNLGIILQGLGRISEAEASYRRSLRLAPGYAQAHGNLGSALKEAGRLNEAEASCRSAVQLNPNYVKAYNNLGVILHELKRLDDAEAAYRHALQINPDYDDAHNNLGITLKAQGRTEEAKSSYQRALEINPNSPEALANLGIIDLEAGRLIEAEARCRRALELAPTYVEALNTLGLVLTQLGRPNEAARTFEKALHIKPDYALAHNSLAGVRFMLGQREEAIAGYQKALQIAPSLTAAHMKLGLALNEMGRLADAEESCRRALELVPTSGEAYFSLGSVLVSAQRLDEAADCFRRALALAPGLVGAYEGLLFIHNYMADVTPEYSLEQARDYGHFLASEAKQKYAEWPCEKRPERLRIGFVSGDFRNHPVGYFIESMTANLRKGTIDLVAYPTNSKADGLTNRIKPAFSQWSPIYWFRNEDAARLIHDDHIHILVDLAGHTSQNRLPVFAWKPAPIQVSWLGYFATTGVQEIDYLLGDPYVTPDTEAHHFIERIWRMPETYLCFTPPDVELQVAPLPALATGRVTFGCFNNLSKLNDVVVDVWARILAEMPKASLFLKTRQLNDTMLRESMLRRFANHGIAAERLVLEGGSPRTELLAAYNRVDIALDPFPYPGGTTSVEGLWMGVPVITKRGDRFLSHVGETIAHNAGLTDWIANDADDYVTKAVRFGSDIESLAKLRSGLRQRVLASPLFDAERFARNFEQAMWGMWQRWQEKQGRS